MLRLTSCLNQLLLSHGTALVLGSSTWPQALKTKQGTDRVGRGPESRIQILACFPRTATHPASRISRRDIVSRLKAAYLVVVFHYLVIARAFETSAHHACFFFPPLRWC